LISSHLRCGIRPADPPADPGAQRRVGQRRAERYPEQILAAAFEEFADHGYEATRLDNVARRAHIAKGTIHLHFRNKEVLFRAVVRGLIRSLSKGFDASVESFSGPAEAALREVVSRQYAKGVRNEKARGLLRLVIAESGKFPQLSSIYRKEVIEPGMAAIRLALEKGVASGEFEKRRVANFPQILAAPAVLAVVWMFIAGERQPFDLDAYFQTHLELVTAGLRKTGAADAAGARNWGIGGEDP
jgi:AcrR family transcriptional regulator